jgi:hypothetical protein
VVLLERISKGLAMEGNLPSQRKFKEMQEELEYKQVQMENAATTQGRLQQELELRKSELEKISTLEEKIKVELAQLQVYTSGHRVVPSSHANCARGSKGPLCSSVSRPSRPLARPACVGSVHPTLSDVSMDIRGTCL